MVKLKAPLLSLIGRGKLGDITFLRRRHTDIAEKTPVVPDVKSLAQLSWRHMYQKAVALWHALSTAEKTEWESAARPKHMTGFAWFMSQALKPNPGLYLPLQGGTMQGDIIMATNKITTLPDPSAAQDADTQAARDAAIAIHAALIASHGVLKIAGISFVAYVGNDTDNRPIAHGLGVLPKGLFITWALTAEDTGLIMSTLSNQLIRITSVKKATSVTAWTTTNFYVSKTDVGANDAGYTYNCVVFG